MSRPPEAVAEIEALMALGFSELKEAVLRRGARLRFETLALLARNAHRQGQGGVDLLQTVASQLLRRVRPIARSLRSKSIRGNQDWEDGTQHAFFSMLRDFSASSDDVLTFWEINFPRIFKLRCIDGINGLRRRVDRDAASFEQLAEEGVELSESPVSPVDQLTRREILSVLSHQEAIAAQLRWFDRLPMSGDGSVAEVMGVSRKTAYKYLARGEAKVKADPRFKAWTERG